MDNTNVQTLNRISEVWEGYFKNMPKRVKPNEKALNQQIEKFGYAFGQVKANIIKHQLSGMAPAAKQMQDNLVKLEQEFDSKLYEYLGYPLLASGIKSKLEAVAKEQNKYFNDYHYKAYPRSIPMGVLGGINDAKQYFPDAGLRIWAIENEPLLKDPVVVGTVFVNERNFYYLVAIWDNDINLSDLIDMESMKIGKK